MSYYTYKEKIGGYVKDMSKIYNSLKDGKYYKDMFRKWEASKTVIDATKALYELKNPESKDAKICMYRDGANVFLYGSYGQFTFDSLTWLAAPNNLQYDNISYMVEKLSDESRNAVYTFDESCAKSEILEWVRGQLEYHFALSDTKVNATLKYFSCEKCDRSAVLEDLNFVIAVNALIEGANNGEENYRQAVYDNMETLSSYDDDYGNLYNAGQTLNQRFCICMYAMEVCARKLTK